MKKMQDRVAIITGATSGIGKATALLFAKEGANIVITGRRKELGLQVELEIQQHGARCIFIQADHCKTENCEDVVRKTISEFGKIDVLFNNSGIVTQGTADTITDEVWLSTMDTNVTAVLRMCRLVIPQMRLQGKGVIINNGSDW
jgi:NAD(P)-dependent dehydrogenase (short-subunit alcohol dehydrogenase family)